MRVSWIGLPQQEEAKATVQAWADNVPDNVELHEGLDPSCDVLIWLSPEALCQTDAKLILRRRFGRKSVLCFHEYEFTNPWVNKRTGAVCNAARLLLFWSKQHEQVFRLLQPTVATPGRAVSIIAKEDYKRKRKKRKTARRYLVHVDDEAVATPEEVPTPEEPTYEDALRASAKEFWGIIRA